MSEDKTREIIKEMAGLTILSGKINPVQERTMKMLPLFVFDDVVSASIQYDLTRPQALGEGVEHSSRVVFELKLPDKQDHLRKKFEYIEKAVRDLFWKEIVVEIYFNGALAFKSLDIKDERR